MKGETLTNARGPRARYLRITTERETREGARERKRNGWRERKRETEKNASIVVLRSKKHFVLKLCVESTLVKTLC